jgi:beta-glucosidase
MDINTINGHSHDEDNVEIEAVVTIKNIGQYDGAEVPQVYLSFPEVAQEPPKLLRGFEKVFLTKGAEKKVTFKFKKTELSYYDIDAHKWVVPSGEFVARFGSSSRNIKGAVKFELS